MDKLRIKLISLLLLIASSAYAIIAQPGLWQKIRLADGTEVLGELKGDEFVHFWQTADGKLYMPGVNGCIPVTDNLIRSLSFERRAKRFTKSETSSLNARMNTSTGKAPIIGQKKGIILLVEFSDKDFTMPNPNQYYQDMANKVGYDNGNQKGSVHDYFYDQSAGQFNVTFDIIGPIKMPNPHTYYGLDEGGNQDVNCGIMICNAINIASSQVSWSDYDWNNDGEVDQVYIVYAGPGQASGGGANTIWPHKWNVSAWAYSGYKPIKSQGMVIDTYACSNEMRGQVIEGIGTICHEFSHCLGFPDMYDTTGNKGATNTNYGMGTWDLMCSGSHNQNGFCPPGYSSWEKMVAGWISPTELSGDVIYENIASQADNGEAFIVYNPGNRNEYYMLENRQKKGWDRSISGNGLMVIHVDYDKLIFDRYNAPNTYVDGINDHQRMTIIHADNTESKEDESTDLYPYKYNNILSNFSTPAARVYNKNLDGSNNMNIKVSDITQNEDGTVSFVFGRRGKANPANIFYESFDNCTGNGANDGVWSSFRTASGVMYSDESGWTSSNIYGGCRCARIGSTASNANLTSPVIAFDGKCTLRFKAAPYANEGKKVLNISSSDPSVTFSETSFQLQSSQWTEFEVEIESAGYASLTFEADCRFYLDEVEVISQNPCGLSEIESSPTTFRGMYSIDGRVTSSASRHGIYIQNGKKVLKK